MDLGPRLEFHVPSQPDDLLEADGSSFAVVLYTTPLEMSEYNQLDMLRGTLTSIAVLLISLLRLPLLLSACLLYSMYLRML